MGTDPLTILLFTIPVFICLEFILVIIPALMNRSRVRKRLRSPPEIPNILYRPLSSEEKFLMRSWVADRNDARSYLKKPLEAYPASLNPVVARNENAGPAPMVMRPEPVNPEPVKDWNAITAASRKVQKANDAIRNTNRAIHEANEAVEDIERADYADLSWLDSLPDMDPLELIVKK